MSVIASTDINNENDDVLFDRKTLEKLKNIDIEELQYDQSSDEDNVDGAIDPVTGGVMKLKDTRNRRANQGSEDEQNEDEDDEIDDKARRIEQMADEIDELYKQRKDY